MTIVIDNSLLFVVQFSWTDYCCQLFLIALFNTTGRVFKVRSFYHNRKCYNPIAVCWRELIIHVYFSSTQWSYYSLWKWRLDVNTGQLSLWDDAPSRQAAVIWRTTLDYSVDKWWYHLSRLYSKGADLVQWVQHFLWPVSTFHWISNKPPSHRFWM